MGIMTLDLRLFQEINSHAKYRDGLKHLEHLEKNLKTLAIANLLCFANKYPDFEEGLKENIDLEIKDIKETKFDYTGHVFSIFQILKWVKCIDYNIELEYLPKSKVKETKKALDQLRYIKSVLIESILSEIEEYNKCEWCDFPKETA